MSYLRLYVQAAQITGASYLVKKCFSEKYLGKQLYLCGAARAHPGNENYGCRSALSAVRLLLPAASDLCLTCV